MFALGKSEYLMTDLHQRASAKRVSFSSLRSQALHQERNVSNCFLVGVTALMLMVR